jgi:glutathione synthase
MSSSNRRYLFVMDPLPSINPVGDTTFDFMLECQTRGIEVFTCGIGDLSSDGRHGLAYAVSTTVRRPTTSDARFFEVRAAAEHSFDRFDAIWMRKDPPVDETFTLSTLMLDRHNPAHTLVLNDPRGIRSANEKLFWLYADDLGPRTVVSSRPAKLQEAIKSFGRGVVKPLSGAGGSGVMSFTPDDRNLRSALDMLTLEGKRPAIAQAYVDDVRTGDKRVILLGGEPIGAILRVPRDDDHRANMHVGGSVKKASVDEHDRRIAARLKPALLTHGLHFVGIDVIGGKLTEVNVTSPTGVQEIDRLDGRTGADRMSAQVMTYVEKLLVERGIRHAT